MSPKYFIREFDKHDHTSSYEIKRFLKKNHFKSLGSGEFCTTYGNDELPYVVKVNNKPDPAAYRFYSIMISKKYVSKHFPKIYDLKTYVSSYGEFKFVVFMERLYKLNNKNLKNVNKTGNGFLQWMMEHPSSIISLKCPNVSSNEWQKKNEVTIKTINAMVDSTSNYATSDFHEGNLMLRLPTGDVVLTDPLCSLRT